MQSIQSHQKIFLSSFTKHVKLLHLYSSLHASLLLIREKLTLFMSKKCHPALMILFLPVHRTHANTSLFNLPFFFSTGYLLWSSRSNQFFPCPQTNKNSLCTHSISPLSIMKSSKGFRPTLFAVFHWLLLLSHFYLWTSQWYTGVFLHWVRIANRTHVFPVSVWCTINSFKMHVIVGVFTL